MTHDDLAEIARSLKRSAQKSQHRKTPPFASAMSMLTFYVKRASNSLSAERKKTLDEAKNALRKLYDKPLK